MRNKKLQNGGHWSWSTYLVPEEHGVTGVGQPGLNGNSLCCGCHSCKGKCKSIIYCLRRPNGETDDDKGHKASPKWTYPWPKEHTDLQRANTHELNTVWFAVCPSSQGWEPQ